MFENHYKTRHSDIVPNHNQANQQRADDEAKRTTQQTDRTNLNDHNDELSPGDYPLTCYYF